MRHPRLAALAALVVVSAASAAPAQAQTMLTKDGFIAILGTQKAFILKYIDAAPDSMLGFRPTPGVRTFAEQIEHASGSDAIITHFIVTGSFAGVPAMGDSTVYRRNKAALRDFATKSIDHATDMIRGLTEAQLNAEITLFGNKLTRSRGLMMLIDHFAWTLGQTVPYLRLNKVTPPAYSPF
ncbi:MAG: DinB family protein [Gemmatimonadales bacterium]|nr:DinB family protein [Gemmatimonadales bacterium]